MSRAGSATGTSRRAIALDPMLGRAHTASMTMADPAIAPGAAGLVPSFRPQTPKPVFIYGGRNDRLVPFATQQDAIAAALKLNGCEAEGRACGENCTIFDSLQSHMPVATFIHSSGHVFVPATKPLIVQFFNEHPELNR